jgi:hypothetical protein
MMLILAQQTPDISAWLIGTPVTVLAFLTFAWMRGWIVSGLTHDRTLRKLDEQAAEIRDLHAMIMDKVVPTLTRATDLMARAAEQQRSI